MRYQVRIEDPIGNAILVEDGKLVPAEYSYDFRRPGMVGGTLVGMVHVEIIDPPEKCWCTNHQYCQCTKHPQECPGSWHRDKNWSGRAECDGCLGHENPCANGQCPDPEAHAEGAHDI